jgi:hypothetical protein
MVMLPNIVIDLPNLVKGGWTIVVYYGVHKF